MTQFGQTQSKLTLIVCQFVLSTWHTKPPFIGGAPSYGGTRGPCSSNESSSIRRYCQRERHHGLLIWYAAIRMNSSRSHTHTHTHIASIAQVSEQMSEHPNNVAEMDMGIWFGCFQWLRISIDSHSYSAEYICTRTWKKHAKTAAPRDILKYTLRARYSWASERIRDSQWYSI